MWGGGGYLAAYVKGLEYIKPSPSHCGGGGEGCQAVFLVMMFESHDLGCSRDNIVGGLEAEAISTDYRGAS